MVQRGLNFTLRKSTHTPVVALLAKLLLEVAQGEAVALHAPPVGDLLAAEEIRHHRLAAAAATAAAAAARSVAPCAFSHPGRRTDGEGERAGTSKDPHDGLKLLEKAETEKRDQQKAKSRVETHSSRTATEE